MAEGKVTLVSSDNVRIEVDRAVATMSVTLKNMFEDVKDIKEVPLPSIGGDVLRNVVEYCEYHHANPDAGGKRPQPHRVDSLCEFDTAFTDKLKTDRYFPLFRTIQAANYLDIKSLLETLCRVVAGIIKDKTADQIMDEFAIKKDATEEEIAEIKAANPWIDQI